jgi:hypothetical protein
MECCRTVTELEMALHEECLELLQILASKAIQLSEFGTWWFPVVVEGLQGVHQGCQYAGCHSCSGYFCRMLRLLRLLFLGILEFL